MRLVLDTNVVASVLLWGGTPRLLLQAGRERRVELLPARRNWPRSLSDLGRRSENRFQRGQFLPDSQPHSGPYGARSR